jgi:hypothetical protein
MPWLKKGSKEQGANKAEPEAGTQNQEPVGVSSQPSAVSSPVASEPATAVTPPSEPAPTSPFASPVNEPPAASPAPEPAQAESPRPSWYGSSGSSYTLPTDDGKNEEGTPPPA